ncbi:MAG: hypothetical protein CL676_03840, partial [Bdellovibrionaceae bacterium]|nr:hypothetical protein [Pseudobdellovibrionaceae bacterium]
MKKQIALSFKSVTILLIFLSSVVACSGPQAEDLANSTENGSFNDQSSGGGSEEVGVGPENPGEGDDPTPTAPTTPEIRTARWEGVSGGRAWTIFTYQTLKDYTPALFTLAPRDVASFCPNYSNLDEYERRDFWVYLISAMAYFESGFDPSTDYREAFNDSHGNPVISK